MREARPILAAAMHEALADPGRSGQRVLVHCQQKAVMLALIESIRRWRAMACLITDDLYQRFVLSGRAVLSIQHSL
jgi:hypothetical protein